MKNKHLIKGVITLGYMKKRYIILGVLTLAIIISITVNNIQSKYAVDSWNTGTTVKNYAKNMYVVDKDSNLWVNGDNKFGQVGNGSDSENVEEFVNVFQNVSYVHDGLNNTFVIDKDDV